MLDPIVFTPALPAEADRGPCRCIVGGLGVGQVCVIPNPR